MSFTTRCPACGTVFRVVADQLKISDGWVRCGHCSDVFDATIHLQAWVSPAQEAPASLGPPAEQAPVPPQASSVEPSAEPPTPIVGAAPVADEGSAIAEQVPGDDDLRAWFGEGPLDLPATASPPQEAALPESPPAADAPVEAAAADVPEQVMAPEFQVELERFAQAARASAPVAALPASAREDLSLPPPKPPEADAPRQAEDDPASDALPGFMRLARRRAFWSSPGMRAVLVVVTLLLATLLAAQWAVQQRHRLVATHPQVRPWMAQACNWLGCDLAPIRRIDAVEIESAELVRRLGNFYSFDFVLRNRSTLEVAVPALELTLTGFGDRPVARRVFLPQDWPDAPPALPPGGSVSVSLRLALMLGDDAPTAGYRALVFYP